MDQTLARFVHALRNAEVEVTPAETLDAMAVLDQVGLSNREVLKDALAMTLAKTSMDKHRYEACFDQFFAQFAFADAPKQTLLDSFEHDALLAEFRSRLEPVALAVTQEVLAGEQTALAVRVQQVAEAVGLQDMAALRDKSRVAERIAIELGVPQVVELRNQFGGELATGAEYVRRYVTTQIRNYVDVQYELVADASGRKTVLEAALAGNLSQISIEYQQEIDRAIAAFADKLQLKYKRRHKRQRRGSLDIRHMIRRNIAYDGALFNLAWRARKKEQGRVFVLCDVSGSVARVSRFLLLLLHSLSDVLPNVRSFAFSNHLGEVTKQFEQHNAARAVEEVLFDWGNGATDYGRAFLDFRELVGTKLDHKSTVVVLGDGRSNFYEPRAEVLKEISSRARQVIWLNPEPRDAWGEGDSEMLRYAPFCLHVEKLATLADLKRATDKLVKAAG